MSLLFTFVLLFPFFGCRKENTALPVTPAQSGLPNTTERKAGESLEFELKGVQWRFRWCPAGTFTMGSPSNDKWRYSNEMQHKVTLTQGFWMGETEVTQEQWQTVTGSNPSRHKGSDHPVGYVGWDDCQKFVNKLNGLLETDLNEVLASDYRFSLPTEAQWEYACRAGSTTRYCFGDEHPDDANFLSDYAWYFHDEGTTHSVGTKKSNAWGLYDMHGNVSEWCQDLYHNHYGAATYSDIAGIVDPTGAPFGSARVVRGGNWDEYGRESRSANRSGITPKSLDNSDELANRYDWVGLRVCLVPSKRSQLEPRTESPPESSLDIQIAVHKNKEPRENAEKSQQPLPMAEQKAGKSLEFEFKDVKWRFRWCPAGTFMMGTSSSDEYGESDETQHKVTLTQGFWMGETEVTQRQWQGAMGNNPSRFQDDNLPVECVTWNDCQKLVKKLNELLAVSSIKNKNYRFSLPTEAQWEYACRAGSTTAYHFDEEFHSIGDYAWCRENSDDTVHPVGTKKPNAWGLYDMYGSVWEWCLDWYGDYETAARDDSEGIVDPTGAPFGDVRVVRGNYWRNRAKFCRSAYRSYSIPNSAYYDRGLRVCLVPSNQLQSEPPEPPLDIRAAVHKNKEPQENAEKLQRLLSTSGQKSGEVLEFGLKGVQWRFRWCLAGSFTMGSPPGEWGQYSNEIAHKVTLTQGFWMSETEVTQGQWSAVMGNNPSKYKGDNFAAVAGRFDFQGNNLSKLKGDNLPVESVSWNDCQEFVSKLNESFVTSAYRFSLPTEAQWEYACRAGSTTAYYFGDDVNFSLDYVWYNGTAGGVYPVGTKKPNAWGLYDTHGNVGEWCQDWYHNDYGIAARSDSKDVVDPTGATFGSNRIIRGGSCIQHAEDCRSAYRGGNSPDYRRPSLGLRLCLMPSK